MAASIHGNTKQNNPRRRKFFSHSDTGETIMERSNLPGSISPPASRQASQGKKWPGLRQRILASMLAASAVVFVSGSAQAGKPAPVQASCHFQSAGNKIKRVVFLTFDNVHLRRDNPNVPSDLEQMPNLFNFLLQNGIVSGNHHTPLISHTAHDIVTALTGVYGARSGIPIANSYGFFKQDGSVGFSSSFLYWTAPSGGTLAGGAGKPQMVNELGKIAPAPWVPYTTAGCDFAGFSTA